jgi:hypothetical protein
MQAAAWTDRGKPQIISSENPVLHLYLHRTPTERYQGNTGTWYNGSQSPYKSVLCLIDADSGTDLLVNVTKRASCIFCTEMYQYRRKQRGRGVILTAQPLLVPRLRKSRTYNPLTQNAPLWSVTGPLYLLQEKTRRINYECQSISTN